MPIYEYRCGSCGHEFEELQKISEDLLQECPACQKPELKKLMSVAGFRLKGSGWYATDFKGGDKGGDKEKPEKKESKPDSSPPCGGACACKQ